MSSPVYIPPLFVADILRSAWPRGRESHREAAFSGHRSTWPQRNTDTPQGATPTPRGGEELTLWFHVKPRGSPVSPLPPGPTCWSSQQRIGS